MDKKKLEQDNKDFKDKLIKSQNERQQLIKDYEKNIERLNKDKASLNKEIENLKKEIEKQKNLYEQQSKKFFFFLIVKNSKQQKPSPKHQDDINNLKKDNETLKNKVAQKEESLKQFSNKIKILEKDIGNLNNALGECSEKFNDEITKRNDDLEFYKRSYEEQKTRVNKEHELISASLYELAMQFMGLKNELQRKMSSNNSMSNMN